MPKSNKTYLSWHLCVCLVVSPVFAAFKTSVHIPEPVSELNSSWIFEAAMDQKNTEVCVLDSPKILFKWSWPCLLMTTVCVVSHQHLSTEAHEEQVQVYRGDATDKEGKKFVIFFFLTSWCSVFRLIMYLFCLTSQAFPSQKSLPGRPELDKVKVSSACSCT